VAIEYLIAVKPNDDDRWAGLLERLDNPTTDNGESAFLAEVTAEGIYFCDHGRSAAAAIAFQRIIDQALVRRDLITIREP
jgi:hypothetical protein